MKLELSKYQRTKLIWRSITIHIRQCIKCYPESIIPCLKEIWKYRLIRHGQYQHITVDIAKIPDELGYSSDYAIPLKIESLNSNIQETEEKSNLLLVLDILRPTFKFSNEEITDVWFSQHYDNMNFTYDIVIGSDFICKEDIHFELAIDSKAVDSYNK